MNILKLALLLFTASRTLDLFEKILGPDNMAVGIFGLAALDGGLIGWSEYYMHSARGSTQNAIAMLMTIVDLVGVVVAFLGDMIMQAASRGVVAEMSQNTAMAVIVALASIIGLNIAAGVFVAISDPHLAQKRKEQEQLDKIHDKVLESMSSEADNIAAQMVPALIAAWSRRTQEQLIANAERQWSVARGNGQKNVTDGGIPPAMLEAFKRRLSQEPEHMATMASDSDVADPKVRRNGQP